MAQRARGELQRRAARRQQRVERSGVKALRSGRSAVSEHCRGAQKKRAHAHERAWPSRGPHAICSAPSASAFVGSASTPTCSRDAASACTLDGRCELLSAALARAHAHATRACRSVASVGSSMGAPAASPGRVSGSGGAGTAAGACSASPASHALRDAASHDALSAHG